MSTESRSRAAQESSPEARLRALSIEVPILPPPAANYVPAVRVGNLVFASGQTPTIGGVLQVRGKLGADVSVEQGQQAARLAALNCLAEVQGLLGSLDMVERVVRLTGFVASAPGFSDQPKVVNGASLLIEEAFGPGGRHARSAVGVAELPGGAPVEIELIVQARANV